MTTTENEITEAAEIAEAAVKDVWAAIEADTGLSIINGQP